MKHKRRVFDLETDGLLDELTRIHVMVVYDEATDKTRVFRRNDTEDTIAQGIEMLTEPGVQVVAHNGLAFDCEVLRKLYGVVIPWQSQMDTIVVSRLIWTDLRERDMNRLQKKAPNFPKQLIGRHSLEAWGHRLGKLKGEYIGDTARLRDLVASGMDPKEVAKVVFSERWNYWNQDMEDYCVQDVEVTKGLLALIDSKDYSQQAIQVEMQVAHIIERQKRHGFLFDSEKAGKLYAKLASRRADIEVELRKSFAPRFLPSGPQFTPARDNTRMGYTAGAPFTKVALTEFNPSSRDHVARWLKLDHGWEPTEFTPDGRPKVDEDVILALPFPSAKPLKDYFMLLKRIGQLAEGKEAWLRKVAKDGRIHGSVTTNGAVTGRMTHSNPNMGQVPSVRAEYGHECRDLFTVPAGYALVGADADALELRDLAGYLKRFDGGAYIKTVLEGDKALGTDMHSVNCRALGMDPKGHPLPGSDETGRDIAKTWFYAFIYGAGDEKLGYILLREWGEAAKKRGAVARAAFLRNLPAMGKLVKAVKSKVREVGHLRGLDGRLLHVRSSHAALNTLLQSAGAVQMKVALCILDDKLQASGLKPGDDYEFVANVHDEWQIECREALAEGIGRTAVESISEAGEALGFGCPLAGAYAVGRSWAETH